MSNPIVYFDLETGGLEEHHPDIQLAAVAIDGGEEVASFEAKIRFDEADATAEALEINSYDARQWMREAIDEGDVVAEFASWLRPLCWIEKTSKRGRGYVVAQLAGHNAAAFDGPRIRAMFARHRAFLPADFRVLDTMQLALWLRPDLRGYTLSDVAEALGVPNENAHDALADARMSARIAEALQAELPRRAKR